MVINVTEYSIKTLPCFLKNARSAICTLERSWRKSLQQEKWNDHTDSKLILSAGSCVAGSSLRQSCESVFTISVFSIFFIFFVFVISSGLCEFFNLPSPSPFSPPYLHSVYFAFSLRRRLYHRLPSRLHRGLFPSFPGI